MGTGNPTQADGWYILHTAMQLCYLDGCAACLGLLYDTFNHNGLSVTGVLYFTHSLPVTANVIDEDDHKGSGRTSP